MNGYVDGFWQLYHKVGDEVWTYVDTFNHLLKEKVRDVSFLKEGKESIMLKIHEEKFNIFANKYLKDYGIRY